MYHKPLKQGTLTAQMTRTARVKFKDVRHSMESRGAREHGPLVSPFPAVRQDAPAGSVQENERVPWVTAHLGTVPGRARTPTAASAPRPAGKTSQSALRTQGLQEVASGFTRMTAICL